MSHFDKTPPPIRHFCFTVGADSLHRHYVNFKRCGKTQSTQNKFKCNYLPLVLVLVEQKCHDLVWGWGANVVLKRVV